METQFPRPAFGYEEAAELKRFATRADRLLLRKAQAAALLGKNAVISSPGKISSRRDG